MSSSRIAVPAAAAAYLPLARDYQFLTALMLDTSAQFAWAVDAEEFGLLWFNGRVRQHFLQHRGVRLAVGMRPVDIFGLGADCDAWTGLFQRAAAEGAISVDHPMPDAAGSLLLTISPMVQDGQRLGLSIFGQDNTEGVLLRETLLQSEEKFRVAFMTSLDGFYLATLSDGRIAEVNGVFEGIFGYSREEVIGRTSLELGLYANPADRAKAVQELRTTGLVRDWELQGVRKNGEQFAASLSQQVITLGVEPHIVGAIRDVSHRKHAEAALERIRVGFEQGAVGQALASPEGHFLQVNAALAQMLGYETADLVGRLHTEIVHPQDRVNAQQAADTLLLGTATYRGDLRHLRSDGATVWTDVSVALVRDSLGSPLYFVCTFVDMTGHKLAEAERARFEAQWKKGMEGATLTLSMALEIRDPHTAGHQRRSADLACAIWDQLGLPQDRREGLRVATLLHDLGKLAIPADILSKPSRLSKIEYALV